MKVVLVEPGKVPLPAEIGDALEDMQNVVGGLIQAVYPFEEPVALVCNEEGKLLGLLLNRFLLDEDGLVYDVIAGTFSSAEHHRTVRSLKACRKNSWPDIKSCSATPNSFREVLIFFHIATVSGALKGRYQSVNRTYQY